MFDKKKMNFWRLAFIFGGFTIVMLVFLWSSPYKSSAEMMNGSMGNTMKKSHLANVTIYDLFSHNNMVEQVQAMGSHHEGQAPIILNMSFLTTSTIFLLIPLIIGGTIALAIIWIR